MGMGGIPGVPAGAAINNGVPPRPSERATLNTYIYDYFLKYEMYDCAQAILREGEVNTNGSRRTSPSRRPQKHDAEGNVVSNGIEDGMDANNASVSSKREEGEDSKPDFPLPSVPKDCPQGCFLYDWWCLFWDIFGARSGAKTTMAAATYLNNTQVRATLIVLSYQMLLLIAS